jgi:hypothetical protein
VTPPQSADLFHSETGAQIRRLKRMQGAATYAILLLIGGKT